ncbi:MAG: ABC transporter substrate-binding protein [Aerococcaceae bacterium]|nr:ABC transporter substrate-binding protein [Aerococcaceae bacterium]
MKKWVKTLVAGLMATVLGSATLPVYADTPAKVDFILDWVPNTNHTGLYVALEKGYFADAGVEVDVKRPPEGSTTELVGLGKAQFGISFQDSLAKRFAGGLPVTAVAAIIEHNTSGVIANESTEIKGPKDMAGKRYGTWNDPIELAMLEYIVNNAGGNFKDVELIPNQADNSVIGLANDMFDSAWVYYAWDGVMAQHQNVPTNFFYFKDFGAELDFYSPVIIANNDYLANEADQAKAVLGAIKKGYQFAIENPEEAADILIKHAPELKDQRDFVVASQKWLSEQYAEKAEMWGHIDETRWNNFYKWLYEQKLVEKDLTEQAFFTNDFLGE